ncbi:hypothetical protein LI951_07285 [Enterococcus sp. BWT-B8]|uniref:hypothetical protein n=1 Tax=Enterococcus sp. BWT-B8 TaxID=2885157 RepID=UPI001E3BCB7C|nr:hypothetical protein [Enterococcus sp. BWT-B8]MCB5951864.1 hypothetical protein [Enterococcus sp. BWT-B8]
MTEIFSSIFSKKVYHDTVNQLSEAFLEKVEQKDEQIFELIGKEDNLKHAVEVAKSAVYPLKGLPTLTGFTRTALAE